MVYRYLVLQSTPSLKRFGNLPTNGEAFNSPGRSPMLQIPGSNQLNGIHSHRLDVLGGRLQAVKKELSITEWDLIDSRFQTLRYLVLLNEMFNSLFLNSSFYISASNIGDVEKFISNKLSFLAHWRSLVTTRSCVDKSCANQFLSPETYHNIKLMCAGFIGFAR
jgi:hypothetical protein